MGSDRAITAVFFCGHKSPFGKAFLDPLLSSRFRILSVILASESRWRVFSEHLAGVRQSNPNSFLKLIRGILHPQKALHYLLGKSREGENFYRAIAHKGITVLAVDDIHEEAFLKKLANQHPDLIFCAAYPQIFKESVLKIPKIGTVNFHPSLLPKYRGAHPHFWVLYNGEKMTGITAHYMTTEVDAGDIIEQISIPISDEMSYSELYSKIIANVPKLVKAVEERFFSGNYQGTPQTEIDSTYFKNDREIHHRIFWTIQSAQKIKNIVRACNGRSYCFWRGRRISISNVEISSSNQNLTNNIQVPNGTVIDVGDNYVALKVEGGVVKILEIIINGKRISGQKLVRILKPRIGEIIQ